MHRIAHCDRPRGTDLVQTCSELHNPIVSTGVRLRGARSALTAPLARVTITRDIMSKRVIVLEFNELCPSLMEQFMKQGLLPGFSRLHSESYAYVTDAEEVAPNLEPWIQWVTVHT